jgi:flavin reductase (DIM6/NTAB) family NADH-FMN oxidoreductase RutF
MEGLLGQLDGEKTSAGRKPMIVDPAAASPVDIYKLLVGAIVPRPIAFVSSRSPEGILNLAPFSFFTAISANPPVICFSPMIRPADASRKDTLNTIELTGEFTVNIVSEEFVEKMNIASAEFPPEVDEFAASGLTPIPSDLVAPPRVKESHIQLECRLVQVVHISPKPLGGSLVIGEVVRFHIDPGVIDQGKIDPEKLHAVGRMAGATYARTSDRFDLERPKLP